MKYLVLLLLCMKEWESMNNWSFLIKVIVFNTIKLHTNIEDKFGGKTGVLIFGVLHEFTYSIIQ